MDSSAAGGKPGGEVSIGEAAVALATDLTGGIRIVVEPEQILSVAKVVVEQADALSSALLQHGSLMRVGPPSNNAISKAVAVAWNDAIVDGEESYLGRIQEYLMGLRQLQMQLRAAAERYQLDDEETAAVFGERRDD